MKKFLLLFTSLTLIAPPVKAEGVWLIMHHGTQGGFEKIEMASLAQCEKQGYISASKTNNLIEGKPQSKAWTALGEWKCLKGK